MITLSIDIDPIPKGRPRFSMSGHAYTPVRTREYERELRDKIALGFSQLPFKGHVELWIDFHITKPKRTKFGLFPPSDIDNLVKALMDAANGLLYEDDRQVVKIIATKTWQKRGKIVISIQEVEKSMHEV